MPATQQSRRRQPSRRAVSNAVESIRGITPIDRRRWHQSREGVSAEEIAARENVRLVTITKSLDKMRAYHATYSQESAEVETRKVYLESLPDAARVFQEAMRATTRVTRQVVKTRYNVMTEEEEEYLAEEVELVPDHAMRLKATEHIQKLNASVIPKQPLVQVDARSQTNFQQNSHPGSQVALSFEAITRQIRSERGLSLGPGSDQPAIQPIMAAPAEVDYELVEELAEDEVDAVAENG